ATATENTLFTPSVTNTTVASNVNTFTLRIAPTADGQSLDLGGNALNAAGLVLSGNRTFSISNGTVFAPGSGNDARNIFVVDPNGVLQIGGNVAAPGAQINQSGPGFVMLTGTIDVVNFGASPKEVVLTGGTLRGAIAGAVTFGTNNILRFRGGVL